MVRIDGRDDRHIGRKPQKRPVEFIGLDGQPIPLAQNQIAVEILRDAAQKGTAAPFDLAVEPGDECRGGRFAVRPRNGHHIFALREVSEHLRTFLYGEAVGAEPDEFTMVVRYGGRIDDHGPFGTAKWFGNGIGILRIVDFGALLFESLREGRTYAVITGHLFAFMQKVTGKGTHADTADAEKIDAL